MKLRFNPSGIEDSDSRLAFTIFTNTTSQELEPQGDILVLANVVKRAEISIKGYVFVLGDMWIVFASLSRLKF